MFESTHPRRAGSGDHVAAHGDMERDLAAQSPSPSASAHAPVGMLVHQAPEDAALFPPTPMRRGVLLIGRGANNEISLAGDLVSRRHAKILVEASGIQVFDLDSHNGVFVNGKKVRSAQLSIGDTLYVGDVAIDVTPPPAGGDPFAALGGFDRSEIMRLAQSDEGWTDDQSTRAMALLARVVDALHEPQAAFEHALCELCLRYAGAAVVAVAKPSNEGWLESASARDALASARESDVAWPIVHHVYASGEAVFADDVHARGDLAPELAARLPEGSVAVLPARANDAVQAVLYVAGAQGEVELRGGALETLSVVAHILAKILAAPPETGGDATLEAGLRAEVERLKVAVSEAGQARAAAEAEAHGERTARAALQSSLDGAKAAAEAANASARQSAEALRNAQASQAEDTGALADAEQRVQTATQQAQAAIARAEAAEQRLEHVQTEAAERAQALQGQLEAATATQAQDAAAAETARNELSAALAQANASLEAAHAQTAAAETARTAAEEAAAHVESKASAAIDALEARAADAEAKAARGIDEAFVSAVAGQYATERATLLTQTPDAPGALTRAMRTVVAVDLAQGDEWASGTDIDTVQSRLAALASAFRGAARAHRGHIVQGGALRRLVLFPPDALGAGAAVSFCAALTAALPPDTPIRMGINRGDVLSGYAGLGSDALSVMGGTAVLTAEEACLQAKPRTVFATRDVADALSGAGIRTIAAGPHLLRGVSAPVELMIVELPAAPEGSA